MPIHTRNHCKFTVLANSKNLRAYFVLKNISAILTPRSFEDQQTNRMGVTATPNKMLCANAQSHLVLLII